MGFETVKYCEDFGFSGNLGLALNSRVEIINRSGFSTLAARVTAPTGGSVSFEASFDGGIWEPISLRSIKNDEYQNVTDNNEDFIGSVSGARLIRFRTASAGSANGTVIGRLNREVSTLEGIEFGWPPHRFGFTPVHKDASFSTAQTGSILWQPATGKTYYVTDVSIIVGGSTDGIVTVFDDTDSTGNRLFKGAIEVATNRQFVFTHQLKTPFKGASDDTILKLTTSAAMTIDVILHGYEV